MGSLDGGDSCAGFVTIRVCSDPEHHHYNNAKPACRTAVAKHHHYDHIARSDSASKPDHANDADHHEDEASSSDDDAGDRLV
jgi:hypothetical protein